MMPVLLLAAAILTATLGFMLLAASQKQHWPLLRPGGNTVPPRGLRHAGWMMLVLSTAPALIRDGMAFGLLLWVMALTVAASLVAVFIALRQRR